MLYILRRFFYFLTFKKWPNIESVLFLKNNFKRAQNLVQLSILKDKGKLCYKSHLYLIGMLLFEWPLRKQRWITIVCKDNNCYLRFPNIDINNYFYTLSMWQGVFTEWKSGNLSLTSWFSKKNLLAFSRYF